MANYFLHGTSGVSSKMSIFPLIHTAVHLAGVWFPSLSYPLYSNALVYIFQSQFYYHRLQWPSLIPQKSARLFRAPPSPFWYFLESHLCYRRQLAEKESLKCKLWVWWGCRLDWDLWRGWVQFSTNNVLPSTTEIPKVAMCTASGQLKRFNANFSTSAIARRLVSKSEKMKWWAVEMAVGWCCMPSFCSASNWLRSHLFGPFVRLLRIVCIICVFLFLLASTFSNVLTSDFPSFCFLRKIYPWLLQGCSLLVKSNVKC